MRFYSQAIELAEGAKQSWVTITRTGDFYDPRYGDFKITPTHLEQMVQNFNANAVGQARLMHSRHGMRTCATRHRQAARASSI